MAASSELSYMQRDICRKLGVSRVGYALRCKTGVQIFKPWTSPGWADRRLYSALRFGRWPHLGSMPRFPVLPEGGSVRYLSASSDLITIDWRILKRRGQAALYAGYNDKGRLRFGFDWLWARLVDGKAWTGAHWTLRRKSKKGK